MHTFAQHNQTDVDPSVSDLSYTFAWSKFICVAFAYDFHIVFCYLVVLSGIMAFVSRVVPVLVPYHVWFGRLYLIFMFWAMATSILIHNTGLPLPIIIFFIFLLVSLSIGYFAIKFHQINMDKAVFKEVDEILSNNKFTGKIVDLMREVRGNIARNKTFTQRLFSLKALHGLGMAFSWYQMFGRGIITNPTKFPGCWTYPAYKTDLGEAVFLPSHDPEYRLNNTTFVIAVSVPAFLGMILIGVIYSLIEAKCRNRNKKEEEPIIWSYRLNSKKSEYTNERSN